MNLSAQRIQEIELAAKPIRTGTFRNQTERSFWGGNQWLSVSSWQETPDRSWKGDKKLFFSICRHLRKHRWKIELDPEINNERFRCLNKNHRWAIKGDLRIKFEYYPSGMKFDIFPTYNTENPNGPQYGFKKYESMTYMDKKRTDLTLKRLTQFLVKEGLANHVEPDFEDPREKIEFLIRKSCHFHEFDTNSGSRPNEQEYNNRDADKKKLQNGQVKYFRDYHGRTMRGTVYHNINNMWWCLTGGGYTNIASFDFFDADSPHFKPKTKSGRKELYSIATQIREAVQNKNAGREKTLRELLWRKRGHSPDDERYVIQCKIHEYRKVLWWSENRSGYTEAIEFAGRYTEKEAQSECSGGRGELMFKLTDYLMATPLKVKKSKPKKLKAERKSQGVINGNDRRTKDLQG